MNDDTRTNAELQAVVYQAMNDPLCQACLAQHECDSEHPLCEQALDDLVRRADEAAVYKRALEILASDGGLWNEANAAKRLRAVLREARKELGL